MHNNKTNLMKNFPIFIFIVTIVIAINGCFFTVGYNRSIELREAINERSSNFLWDIIASEIESDYVILNSDAKYLSKKLESAILREYGGDMNNLKSEFDTCVLDQGLYDLFKEEIEEDSLSINDSSKNESFNYTLGFRDNIIAIFKDSNTSNDTNTSIQWHDVFIPKYNKELSESLINDIVNKDISNNILIYQNSSIDMSGGEITQHSIDSLKIIYEKFGIDGLKYFDFVNVSYITDYGDVFDTDDFLYLDAIPNHKMIIVKTTNIYDSISKEIEPKIKEVESCQKILNNRISDDIARDSLQFIITTLCLVILVAVSSIMYNKNLND